MDVRDEPERIEVELTSGAPDAPDGPAAPVRQGAAVAVPEPPARSHRSTATARVAVAVGLAGLVVGWVLGRSDGPAEAPTAGSEVTAAPSAPDDDAGRVASATTARPPPPVVPIAPVTPVPGDAEPLATRVVGLPAPVSGQALEIVAYGNGRTLTRLDLTDGTLRTQVVQPHASGRPRVLVGEDWILMPTPDGETPSLLVDADGEVARVDFGDGRRVVAVSGLELVWLSTSELGVDAVTIDGEPAGSIDLPAPAVGVDLAGGFVVEHLGGWYRVDAGATARITPGELLALGGDVALARECDTRLRCDVVVIDRATDERTALVPTWPDREGPPDLRLASTSSMSPDGRQAVVVVGPPSDRSSVQLGVISLESGAVVEIGRAEDVGHAAWTPDGRFVLYDRAGRIIAFDTSTGDGFAVSDELIGVDVFAVRPPLPRVGF